ncbi:endo-1,4-beta-xylanase [Bacteroidia bacterium]|nr:endo-1,4-beta-xylanase [Bacteroidia bacterium]
MKNFIGLAFLFLGIPFAQAQEAIRTICNPLNLSYMYSSDKPSYREAADPSVVLFKDEYYMFLSKSGGYFHSTDLIDWDLITTADLPLNDYAPTAVVIGDEIYFMTSGHNKIYKTADPKSGKWEVAKNGFAYTHIDPMLFLDDDGRLYYYGGCSNTDPIRGVEIDPKTFNSKGSLKALIKSNKTQNGWEVPGNYNSNDGADPWIEGAWMNKHDGKYFLQYACPGTEFKSYNDGVYVSDNPLGPFVLAKHNPFAYKPEGFVCGAGHGSTFQDKYGNYWHVGSATISLRHSFERRISLFPVFFDEDNVMYAYTGFGDYPLIIPGKKISGPEELFPKWLVLSYKKEATASSELKTTTKAVNAVDEDIRTEWSAQTADAGEFFMINLGQECTVQALQINFADVETDLAGRNPSIYYQYLVEYSTDGEQWQTVINKSENTIDAPHDYIQLEQGVQAQYVRLTNVKTPSKTFALSDFRIFGKSAGEKPDPLSSFRVRTYSLLDNRKVYINWTANPNTVGYNIRFGTEENKLYENYLLYDKKALILNSLSAVENYYFSVDVFNEAGITRGTDVFFFSHTGIETIGNATSVAIYPNPVEDILKIRLTASISEKIKLEVYDLQGVLQKQEFRELTAGDNEIQTDLSHLSAGFYLLKIQTQGENITQKIVVK